MERGPDRGLYCWCAWQGGWLVRGIGVHELDTRCMHVGVYRGGLGIRDLHWSGCVIYRGLCLSGIWVDMLGNCTTGYKSFLLVGRKRSPDRTCDGGLDDICAVKRFAEVLPWFRSAPLHTCLGVLGFHEVDHVAH